MFVRSLVLAAVAVSAILAAAGQALAQDRHVRIINNSSSDIYEFYASNIDSQSWEEDILGEDILPAGYSVVIDIDDGSDHCKCDFRAIFSDGDEAVTEAVNVCEVTEFTYHD